MSKGHIVAIALAFILVIVDHYYVNTCKVSPASDLANNETETSGVITTKRPYPNISASTSRKGSKCGWIGGSTAFIPTVSGDFIRYNNSKITPWTVFIYDVSNTDEHTALCTGIVVHKLWVLAYGSCIDRGTGTVTIRAGGMPKATNSTDARGTALPDPWIWTRVTRTIAGRVEHPRNNDNVTNVNEWTRLWYDFVLLRLNEPLYDSEPQDIGPICLPNCSSSSFVPGPGPLYAGGWLPDAQAWLGGNWVEVAAYAHQVPYTGTAPPKYCHYTVDAHRGVVGELPAGGLIYPAGSNQALTQKMYLGYVRDGTVAGYHYTSVCCTESGSTITKWIRCNINPESVRCPTPQAGISDY